MKVVVAPNSLKGSLSAIDAAQAMAHGVRDALAEAEIIEAPVSDGGDGLIDVLVTALDGERRTEHVTGPRGRRIQAQWAWMPEQRLAVVEMAAASGLALLRADEYDVLHTTTRGTGQLIRVALDAGAEHILVGIGGSATNDGGMGAAASLGVRFLDEGGCELDPCGASLGRVERIDTEVMDARIESIVLEVICDVRNPLLGDQGAARVYARQKGASPADVDELESGMEDFARVLQRDLGVDARHVPGAGAAGGLGAGLYAMLGAELCDGAERVLEIIRFRERARAAELVLTSEGRLDAQTAFGKATGAVARAARELHIPCIAVVGEVGAEHAELDAAGFNAAFSLCLGPCRLQQAMRQAGANLRRATEEVVRTFRAARASTDSRGTGG